MINSDLTIVTACSGDKYLKRLENALGHWYRSDFIKSCRIVIFTPTKYANSVQALIGANQHNYNGPLDLELWDASGSAAPKEDILSAFVFGVPQVVRTKYWCKLDCDCTLKQNLTVRNLPHKWYTHTLNGHKWSYTKVKHDPEYETKGHWLNRLDEWADKVPDFAGTERLFDRQIAGIRHGHKRICTFFSIEKLSFTKHLSEMCKQNGGRMPVPSHDTLVWYVITRLGGGRTINYVNFKIYWSTR